MIGVIMTKTMQWSIAQAYVDWLQSPVTEYEGESIGNQPNLFPVEIHVFFFDVIAL